MRVFGAPSHAQEAQPSFTAAQWRFLEDLMRQADAAQPLTQKETVRRARVSEFEVARWDPLVPRVIRVMLGRAVLGRSTTRHARGQRPQACARSATVVHGGAVAFSRRPDAASRCSAATYAEG